MASLSDAVKPAPVTHDVEHRVARRVSDHSVLSLIRMWLATPVKEQPLDDDGRPKGPPRVTRPTAGIHVCGSQKFIRLPRLARVLSRVDPAPAQSDDHLTASLTPPEVFVTDLHKAFGDHPVLQGINLCIRRGELVAIVGGSGSGKTVLLKHLTGHYQPDSGRVMVADHESIDSPLRSLAEMTEDELDRLRVHWAVVFQRNALLTGTVYENLALWPKEIKRMTDKEIMPLATKALIDVGLDPAQVMSSPREALSGGMAKRLAIARAIVMDPVLIFYDEPTAGLDPEMSATIHGLIGRTHESMPALGLTRTSVVVTHDTELLRRLHPRIVMIYEGCISFDGTFDEFVASTDSRIRPYVEQMPILQAVLRNN